MLSQLLSAGRHIIKNAAIQVSTQLRSRHGYVRNRTRVKRDLLRRACVDECQLTRLVYKALHRDERLDMRVRLKAMMSLHQMHSYTRPHELKDRCVETGRGHGVVRAWRMSRIQFRENAINARLSGVREAKW